MPSLVAGLLEQRSRAAGFQTVESHLRYISSRANRRYAVLASLARLREELYESQAKSARLAEEEEEEEEGAVENEAAGGGSTLGYRAMSSISHENGQTLLLHSISGIKEYGGKSTEMIRFEDYLQGRKDKASAPGVTGRIKLSPVCVGGEQECEKEEQAGGVLSGLLAFDIIHSDDLWRHILEFV